MRSSYWTSDLADAPCGCRALADLAREGDDADPDGDRAAQAEADACAWRCPNAGFAPPGCGDDPLPEPQQDALKRIAATTGARDLGTCPGWYTQRPWVHRAVRAHAWREHGELACVEGDHPPGALIDAIDLVASAIAAREAREHDDRMRDAESRAREQTPPR